MKENEYNKELMLVHQFLQEKHHEFRQSNRIKSNEDRRKYAHAVKTVGDIAYNCNITPKPNPNEHKKNIITPQNKDQPKEEEEETTNEEHTELYNMATTD